MPEIRALAKKLKGYRKELGKTQFEIAGEMGISIEEVSLIEREKANPGLRTMQKMAAHMGITVSELLKIGEEE